MSRTNAHLIESLFGLGIVALIFVHTNNLTWAILIGILALPLIFSSWITARLSGSSEDKILRHFKRKPSVRLKIVREIVDGQHTSLHEFSPLELVTVLCWFLAKFPLDKVIQKIVILSDENRAGIFDEAFFQALDNTIYDFRIKGFSDERYSLLQLAENIAKHHHQLGWAEKYHQEYMQVFQRHKENQPVIRMKVK